MPPSPSLFTARKAALTGLAEGTATVGSQAFTFGVVSNGDDLAERYSGILARYEDKKLGSDRVRFRFLIRKLSRAVEPGHHGSLELGLARSPRLPAFTGRRDNFEPR